MTAWQLALGNLAKVAPPEPMKVCGRCKEPKPLDQFYFMGGRYSRACRVCLRQQVYARRKA